MLVYGDHVEILETANFVARLRERVREHGCDTWALIEAGRLAQGLLDAEFAELGYDECTPLANWCAGLLCAIAAGDGHGALDALEIASRAASPQGTIALRRLPPRLSLTLPEGYAFYAVYPGLYSRAVARRDAELQVVGIRSIGTSLGAVVATAAGARDPVFVRPAGDPFRREPRLGPALRKRLSRAARVAVVDEGPGLSGSSFLGVARQLLSLGVARECIEIFPSHGGGPGGRAGDDDRALWEGLRKRLCPFESVAGDVPRWCEDLTGPAYQVTDLSGGRWRALVDETLPANVHQERRKYLARTGAGTFLLKFAGLGPCGDDVFRRARALGAGGFSPDALGLRNGFLVQRWEDGHRPPPGADLHDGVARYVAFRSRELEASAPSGADPALLLEMARRNVSLSLGEDAARQLAARFQPRLDSIASETFRVETDNRMHRWEWLRRADGKLLKTDSADHCRAHDLIGCQDPAWDIAGAAVELGLDEASLVRRFRALGGRGCAPSVLEFSRIAYLAFQLGAFSLAADALDGMDEESERLRRFAERYRVRLAAGLA